MADDDSLFLATDESVVQVGDWLAEVLRLEPIPEPSDIPDEVGLRGRAATIEDGWLGFLVHRNWHAESDPEPDEVQAIDPYSVQIDIWYSAKDEVVQQQEARLVFDALVTARPDIAMLLSHNLTILVAAHLPGAGTHYFDSKTTLDAPDQPHWQPWVCS
ncbi:hypothetical protein ACFPJ1_01950 [Kribbella qitaiheensis]|uniref:hypothetical protein n=1 Tax=Kribbella qitaiheensis TaxID=1544730 RepID=UPI00361D96ED